MLKEDHPGVERQVLVRLRDVMRRHVAFNNRSSATQRGATKMIIAILLAPTWKDVLPCASRLDGTASVSVDEEEKIVEMNRCGSNVSNASSTATEMATNECEWCASRLVNTIKLVFEWHRGCLPLEVREGSLRVLTSEDVVRALQTEQPCSHLCDEATAFVVLNAVANGQVHLRRLGRADADGACVVLSSVPNVSVAKRCGLENAGEEAVLATAELVTRVGAHLLLPADAEEDDPFA
jgi:hypothetical protein